MGLPDLSRRQGCSLILAACCLCRFVLAAGSLSPADLWLFVACSLLLAPCCLLPSPCGLLVLAPSCLLLVAGSLLLAADCLLTASPCRLPLAACRLLQGASGKQQDVRSKEPASSGQQGTSRKQPASGKKQPIAVSSKQHGAKRVTCGVGLLIPACSLSLAAACLPFVVTVGPLCSNGFQQAKKEAIMMYLVKQPIPINPEASGDVMLREFSKFDFHVAKAHMRRVTRASVHFKKALAVFNGVRHWNCSPVSAAANAAWVGFAYYPQEAVSAVLAGLLTFTVYRLCRIPFENCLHPPDASLYGLVVGHTDDNCEHAVGRPRRPHNPYTLLHEKIERFEDAGNRTQTAASTLASGMESVVNAGHMTNFVITAIFALGVAGLLVAVWCLPLPLLISISGCYVMRPPMFRKPVPSKVLCLFARMPNDRDAAIIATT